MNEWLAQIYGTAGADDIEKTAQAHLLQKLAENEGIDLNQFSPEELQALAEQVLMANGGQLPQAAAPQAIAPAGGFAPQQGAPTTGFAPQHGAPTQAPAPQQSADALMKEAQAKFEEADLLGRVMAHAYTQELEKIAAAKAQTKVAGRFTKKASAFEKLAEEHAANILSAVGIDPATGMDMNGQQAAVEQQVSQQPVSQAGAPQQVDNQAQFQQALDTRALEILENAGYDVEAILGALAQQSQGVQQ